MAADCCDHRDSSDPHRGNPAYRRVLWAVLAINAVMFAVEIGAGLAAGSAALQADALDFLGDAANYGISLSVVGMALRYRAMAAFAKGATMGVFGLWVTGTILARGAWHLAERPHHGRRRLHRFGGQCCVIWPALGLSRGRRKYALSVDLYPQRRARQFGGLAGSGWGIRHRYRMARYHRGSDHGRPCAARGINCGPGVSQRTAPAA
jgi:hypothetical protein